MRIYLEICPCCHKDNWLGNIPFGVCGWCGYNAHKDNINNLKVR